jgi:nitrilase
MGEVRVAVIQAASVIMDKAGSIDKALALAAEAADNGAKIMLFPEAFVPGYPRDLGFGTVVGSRSEAGREDFARYWANSVVIPGPETAALGGAARKARAYLACGVIERDPDGGTLYCTIVYFGPDGEYLGKHRKLKPTAAERLIWGEGDGSTLFTTATPYGRLGGLICWENYMPLARAAMYAKGVSLYLAPTADARETWQATIRHIALEGRCFVLACNQFVTKDMYPKDLACLDDLVGAPEVLCNGGSAIVDPLGRYVTGPEWGRESILIADLDTSMVPKSRFDFDVVGHYARPDVFELVVNEEPKLGVRKRAGG